MKSILRNIRRKIAGWKYTFFLKTVALANDKQSHPRWRMMALFWLAVFDVNHTDVGSLWSRPSGVGLLAAIGGLVANHNNLGNPFSKSNTETAYLAELEREVIDENRKLINFNDPLEGYVTSGGTEANLYLMWLGKEWLQTKQKQLPTLLLSEFAHYSLSKSARIMGLGIKKVKVDTKCGLDLRNLRQIILSQIKAGQKTFLLPLTIGYSSIGTSDDVEGVVEEIVLLKSKYPQLEIFLWIDAAAQGLVKSYLDPSYQPLKSPLLQGYVVDFHKFGRAPVPAGVVLYRPELRKLVEKPIDYLLETDATLLGSRPGFSVLSVWANLKLISHSETKTRFKKLVRKKNLFLQRLKKIRPEVKVIGEPNSLTLAIAIDQSFPKFNQEVEEKFGLVECEIGGRRHYKIHFLK